MNASGQIAFGLEFARRFREDGYVCIPNLTGADTIAAVLDRAAEYVRTVDRGGYSFEVESARNPATAGQS